MKRFGLAHYSFFGLSSLYFILQLLGYDSFLLITIIAVSNVIIIKRGLLTHLYHRYSYKDYIKGKFIEMLSVFPLVLNGIYQSILGNHSALYLLLLSILIFTISFVYELKKVESLIILGMIGFLLGLYNGYNSDVNFIFSLIKTNTLFVIPLGLFVILVIYVLIRNRKMRFKYEKVL